MPSTTARHMTVCINTPIDLHAQSRICGSVCGLWCVSNISFPFVFSFWTLMALECSLLPFFLEVYTDKPKKPTLFTSFRVQTSCLGDGRFLAPWSRNRVPVPNISLYYMYMASSLNILIHLIPIYRHALIVRVISFSILHYSIDHPNKPWKMHIGSHPYIAIYIYSFRRITVMYPLVWDAYYFTNHAFAAYHLNIAV
jgi:hypothetical protein